MQIYKLNRSLVELKENTENPELILDKAIRLCQQLKSFTPEGLQS